MKYIYISILLLGMSNSVLSQKYGTAAGIRFGDTHFGVSVKQRVVQKFSFEGIAELQSNSYRFIILPKFHLPITGEGLNLYFGAGMHAGKEQELGSNYGYDIVGGIEWKIPVLPLVIGADIKPSYNVNQSDWFDFPISLSAHYVLSKETKAKRKRDREKRKRRRERRERREERKEKRQQWWDNIRESSESEKN